MIFFGGGRKAEDSKLRLNDVPEFYKREKTLFAARRILAAGR